MVGAGLVRETPSDGHGRMVVRAVVAALVIVSVVILAVIVPGLNLADAHAYWQAKPDDPYAAAAVGSPGAYLYAPAFLQAIAPLTAMSWPVFASFWLLGSAIVLYRLVGPWAILVAMIPPVITELQVGNIHILLALAIGLSPRWPGAWALVLLTKPTLGVGLLWWIARREWRPLGIALATTAGISLVSFALAPEAWRDWVQVLAANAGQGIPSDYNGVIHLPLWLRLSLAAVVVVWGARTDRPWTLALAATLALPVLWINGLTILLAIPMLEGWTRAGFRVRSCPRPHDPGR